MSRVIKGENAEHESDGHYTVSFGQMGGIQLAFRALAWVNGGKNQYPIHATLCEKCDNLATDHRGEHHDRLALCDTWGENTLHRRRWQQNHYSADIEVIGNIHQNPELLERAA